MKFARRWGGGNGRCGRDNSASSSGSSPGYKAIADDTLFLGDGQPRAIFEVYPPNLSLAEDDALEAGAHQLAIVLNALKFPIQLLFRCVSVDLERLAAEAEQAALGRSPELARAARDYAALLRYLSRTMVLLELHVYLTMGLDGARGSVLQAIVAWLSQHLSDVRIVLWPARPIPSYWTSAASRLRITSRASRALLAGRRRAAADTAQRRRWRVPGNGRSQRPAYWLGLAVASQEPADCLNSPYGLAVYRISTFSHGSSLSLSPLPTLPSPASHPCGWMADGQNVALSVTICSVYRQSS
jgi:hypothetical protein